MAIGAATATISSIGILGVFHLLVVKIPMSIAGASIAASFCSGALASFEGGNESEGGGSFGTIVGVIFGGIGGYYARSISEPWHSK